MKRIAAIAGIGIHAAYGISTTRIRRSVTECTIPAIGVRPPFLTLAAVLAIAPVAGIPPNRADTRLPAPCATSSILGLCLLPIIPSETTHDKSDSIPASTAIVNASGKRFLTIVILTCGMLIPGSLLEIVYKSPIVLACIPSLTIITETITAIKDAGIFSNFLNLGHIIRIASETPPTTSACQLNVLIHLNTAFNLSSVSIVGPVYAEVSRPKKSLICPTRIVTAIPNVNPVVIV